MSKNLFFKSPALEKNKEKSLLACFDGKTHKGDYLEEIYRAKADSSFREEHVIYWCKECGAVVLDIEYNRAKRGFTSGMKFSNSCIRILNFCKDLNRINL